MVDSAINYDSFTVPAKPRNRSVISAGATQLIMPANPLRKGFFIENNSDTVWYLSWITATVVADASGVFELVPGASISAQINTDNVPKGAIYGLGTNLKTLYAEENIGYSAYAAG